MPPTPHQAQNQAQARVVIWCWTRARDFADGCAGMHLQSRGVKRANSKGIVDAFSLACNWGQIGPVERKRERERERGGWSVDDRWMSCLAEAIRPVQSTTPSHHLSV